MNGFPALFERMQELKDLAGLLGLAGWDQETYLPKKAAAARASQSAALQGVHHERLVDPRLGELLDEASASTALSEDQRAMVRVLKRERDRAVKVPGALVRAIASAQSVGVEAWKAARANKDFSVFAPALGRLVALRQEEADAIGHGGERYDVLLDGHEPGMSVARLEPVLGRLSEKLVPLVAALTQRSTKPDALAGRTFPEDAQWKFCRFLLAQMGFDFEAGRLDESVHPFTGGSHARDVRLTLRVDRSTPLPAIFGALHEGGHGLYEQGFAEEHHRSPLASAPSLGLHESQSRLWENIVGRGRPFWSHYYPALQQEFPEALRGVSLDAFLASVNRVEKSLTRVEADEVTYNLHVLLRFRLELLLLRGTLAVSELPGAWNSAMRELLDVSPPDDVAGVLQDIHWAWGEFGYFPTYTLGNLYAASLYQVALAELPDLEARIAKGELVVLRDWLRRRIHREGFRRDAEELVTQVTGKGLSDEAFVRYLGAKYGAPTS